MEKIQYANVHIYIGVRCTELHNYIPASKLKNTICLVDENVYNHWKNDFSEFPCVLIPSGEEQKTWDVVEKIILQLIEMGADRHSFLVGIGGGVVTDLTGFIASIFMRGIEFAFVPTTVLAQVDAAIGGKNGVNTRFHKNMVGVINQPKFILCDPLFFNTLPKEEYINGMAEIIKHACIDSLPYFEFIENNIESILAMNMDTVRTLIVESIKIKTKIVEMDLNEKNIRKKLNFGHTFGHAIEKIHHLAHGKAVSLGIVKINEIAVKNNYLAAFTAERIKKLLTQIGLPTDLSFTNHAELVKRIQGDKKKNGALIDMIFLKEIGFSEIIPVKLEDI